MNKTPLSYAIDFVVLLITGYLFYTGHWVWGIAGIWALLVDLPRRLIMTVMLILVYFGP
jgi:hypothetical protein